MNKSLIVSGVAVSVFILVLGGYLFTRGDEPEDLIAQKNKLLGDFAVAGEKLNKEKEILDTLTNSLRESFALAFSVQDQMKKASSLVARTDFMFTNTYGANPELIVQNPLTSILINNERKNVNLLLSEWKTKTNILSIDQIDVSGSEKIKQDVQTIKTFIEHLSQIVASLTPENSGLSQFEIDAYASAIPTSEDINEVLASLQIAIENSVEPESNPTSSSPTPNSTVTPEEVVLQQEVVTEAQTEVTLLQEQLAQIEEQIEQASLVPAPTPADTTADSNSGDQTEVPSEESEDDDNYGIPDTSQGIIIQPGPPRLIQGTDPF